MKLAPLLSFLDQLKVLHWQTFSYAEHKALGKAYEILSEHIDEFVETYYGKYGKEYVTINYNFNIDSYSEGLDVKKLVAVRKRELISYLRNDLLTPADQDLKNIVDSIEGEINHLQYFLDLKK